MKLSPFRKDKGGTEFICKECRMAFRSKDSLELHKRKSGHVSGYIYFGKHEKG